MPTARGSRGLVAAYLAVNVLGGALLCRLRHVSPIVFRALAALLVLATVHNAGALVTRYPQWDGERSMLTGSPHEWLAGRRVD
jgi:hypothetical protein